MRNTATTKQTSGKGFSFENKVCSYFAVQMLANVPFSSRDAEITELAFQRKRFGWLLDDVVLTLRSRAGEFHAAFSVKSNQQFSPRSAPSEFVSDGWHQLLHEGTDCFDASADVFGLVTSPLPEPPKSALHALLAKACHTSPSDLDATMLSPEKTASETERALYASFRCPAQLASKYGSDSIATGQLLHSLTTMEFDFDSAHSKDEAEAIRCCRTLLERRSQDKAAQLWHSILAIVDEFRTEGGSIDRPTLSCALAAHHDLEALPDFAHDWDRLRRFSQDNVSVIPDTIGGEVSLPRENARRELQAALAKKRAVVIVGPSGTGKTVVAKSYCALGSEHKNREIVWFDCRLLTDAYFDDLPSRLGLTHTLAEILAHCPRGQGLLVLDGLDALHGEPAFQQIARLLHALETNGLFDVWRLLATCQAEPWQRVEAQLSRMAPNSMPWCPVHIAYPSDSDLKPVWKLFPRLAQLALRPHLKMIIVQPKILDILARGERSGHAVDAEGWVGESDLIDWYWMEVVRGDVDPDNRSHFLMTLAQRQADRYEFLTPLSECSPVSTHQIPDFVKAGICCRRDESLAFVHDLIGDWSRQRVLLANASNLATFLENRVLNPRWLRAIQLLGLDLLESSDGATEWKKAIDSCPAARDAFLGSIVFAADAIHTFEKLWPALSANSGDLLRHFLARFLHVATVINPSLMKLFAEDGDEMLTYARTHDRLPLWPYWLPVLSVLHRYRATAIALAPLEVSRVAYQWLRLTPSDYPNRQEAAVLALERAEP
ncbi:MAG: ATP-binding protein, partial [Planctomycetes bacterium]|nr:ATP-binding protein [Planctomycetota bacterium]